MAKSIKQLVKTLYNNLENMPPGQREKKLAELEEGMREMQAKVSLINDEIHL